MYYGGDVIEVALAVVIAAIWYSASGRALARARRHAARSSTGGAPADPAVECLALAEPRRGLVKRDRDS
jgi:putative membrane protein